MSLRRSGPSMRASVNLVAEQGFEHLVGVAAARGYADARMRLEETRDQVGENVLPHRLRGSKSKRACGISTAGQGDGGDRLGR